MRPDEREEEAEQGLADGREHGHVVRDDEDPPLHDERLNDGNDGRHAQEAPEDGEGRVLNFG